MRSARVGRVVAALSALAVLPALPARAELPEAIGRVAQVWRTAGATVVVQPTRFLNEGQAETVVLDALPPGPCTTIALLGARGLGFHVRVVDAATDGDAPERLTSQAGALSFERCGGQPPLRLLVTSDSGRGALETAIARSAGSLPLLRGVLPERIGGSWMPGPEPGALAPLPPPDHRADVAESRAKREGARVAERRTLYAGGDGSGSGEEVLEAGCHTLRLFPVDPRATHLTVRAKVDLDAEMRSRADDRVLARDRTDAPDAELSVCVGDTTAADVLFAGSPPGAPVLESHLAWPLPAHLPSMWGGEVRARMARVLLARHVVSLPRAPYFLTQGGPGTTPVPLEVEPGGCYLAVVSVSQGTGRGIGLRVRVGVEESFDDRGVEGGAAATAFCAGSRSSAVALVEAHGAPMVGWALAVYRVEDRVWEGPR